MRIMREMFNFERIILGGSGLGVARSAFDIATAHAQRRDAFGAKLGSKELIWSDIAEMSWRIDAAELLTYRAAKLYDAGTAPRDLMKPAAMAKLVGDRDGDVLRRPDRADPRRRRTHEGIRARRADLSRRARAADRRRDVGDRPLPDRDGRPSGDQAGTLTLASPVHSWTSHRSSCRPRNAIPNHTALIFENRRWTYREWYARVRRFAQGLADLGVRPSDRVAFYVTTSENSVTTYFACQMLGAVAVPLNFRLAAGEAAVVLQDSGARMLSTAAT